jgi:hypothetical protein
VVEGLPPEFKVQELARTMLFQACKRVSRNHQKENSHMKSSTILFLAAALMASPVAVVSVKAQTTTESTTTTTTTAPAVPGLAPPTITTESAASAATGATSAAAAHPGRGRVLGKVENGNSTIVFKAANRRDIDSNSLRMWDDFAQDHPSIANTLAHKPELIDDPGYLRKHPVLDAFMQAHPDIKDSIIEDPGNFAAIPPRPGE